MFTAVFTGCTAQEKKEDTTVANTAITLSDEGIMVDGSPVSSDSSAAVYAANDIIFYLAGKGAEYGEGQSRQEHTQREADKHTVVYITQPGNYTVSGSLSYGQIVVDLGKDALCDSQRISTRCNTGIFLM